MIIKLTTLTISHIMEMLKADNKLELYQRFYQCYHKLERRTLWNDDFVGFIDITQPEFEYLISLAQANKDNINNPFTYRAESLNTLNELKKRSTIVNSKFYKFLVEH